MKSYVAALAMLIVNWYSVVGAKRRWRLATEVASIKRKENVRFQPSFIADMLLLAQRKS